MEKLEFLSPDTGETMDLYVVEQTKIGGVNYLLAAEEEEEDCEAFILKELSQEKDEEAMYELVESEEELEYISRIFEEILEDVDLI